MSWSLNIGRIAGTAIRVHVTFLLFLGWIFAASYAAGGSEAAWSALLFMILLFACVVAHEFGHIFTARAFGVPTPDVTLLPIGGVARLERIPEAPREEFLIAIAGPLVNIAIAFALVLLAGARLNAAHLAAVDSMHVSLADRLAVVNIFLALFNIAYHCLAVMRADADFGILQEKSAPAVAVIDTRLFVVAAIVEAIEKLDLAYPAINAEKEKELQTARAALSREK
jgi:hypothetical protein